MGTFFGNALANNCKYDTLDEFPIECLNDVHVLNEVLLLPLSQCAMGVAISGKCRLCEVIDGHWG